MRIAVGGVSHETNTYAVASTGLTEVDEFEVYAGARLVELLAGTGSGIGGILDECARRGDEILPTSFAIAHPSGTIAAGAYAEVKARLLESLAAALPVDAVALELHGAGVAEGIDDIESDLGVAIRQIVGDAVPISAVLDLHGNVTPAMGEVFDLLLGCHLYPHTDLDARGVESVELLHRIVEGDLRPTMHVTQLPMLLPPATTDGENPAALVNAVCAEIEKQEGVIDCTFMHGFPFTDIPDAGASMITITDGKPALAEEIGATAAAWVWDHRERFRTEVDTPESAVRLALTSDHRPVVINECSDNPGAGTPGDGTHLLRAMIDADLQKACFGFITDAEVVAKAIEAGVGEVIEAQLGGKHDDLHGAPISISGTVRCISDGLLTLRAMLAGVVLPLGPSCRLTVGGIDVIVTSKPFQTIDPEIFLMHGIDVTRYDVIGLKSSQHFRAGFRDIAGVIITADSPGLSTNRVEVFEHQRLARPSWPVDGAATFASAAAAD